jgi:hypothetical protein
MLTFDTIDDQQGSRAAAKSLFRDRAQEVYSGKAANTISVARRFLSEKDNQEAEKILEEAKPWIDLASEESQDAMRTLFAEVSGNKGLFGRLRN